jgi:hypothetical protein
MSLKRLSRATRTSTSIGHSRINRSATRIVDMSTSKGTAWSGTFPAERPCMAKSFYFATHDIVFTLAMYAYLPIQFSQLCGAPAGSETHTRM